MPIRAYVGLAIGALVGFLIGEWFIKGAPPSDVLLTLRTICGAVGAAGGFAAGSASKAGNGRAGIAAGVGLVGCLLVGLAIVIYRWLFL